MPTFVHAFDWPDRLLVGTIGRPGERTFFLQARDGGHLVSVMLEKEQAAVLAEKVDELLDEVAEAEGESSTVPAVASGELIDEKPLDQPVEAEFRVGTITLGWDPSTAQVVIEAYPMDERDDDDVPEPGYEPTQLLQVRIPVGTARAFAKRTDDVVRSGRRLDDA